MALVSSIVRSALLNLKAIDAASAVPAQDMEDAIAQMNRMCTRWEASGLAMGWSNVSAPDDTMPSPDEAELAIIYNLSILLQGYARPSDFSVVLEGAQTYLADLRRDRLMEVPLRMTSDLPMPERGGHFNCITDEYN
jgi:hypothetical protein